MTKELGWNYWGCDWGTFIIPDDVPFEGQFRKDGYYDKRRKITPKLKAYFSDMNDRLRDRKGIQTWAEWQADRCRSLSTKGERDE
jgi:hypothetical protein